MARRKKPVLKAEEERQLRLAAPGLLSDLVAGRIASPRKVLELAGIRPERSRLEKLRNSWDKAEETERQAFLQWLGDARGIAIGSKPEPIADGRYLTPHGIRVIEDSMRARRLQPEDVMASLGFPGEGRALIKALARRSSLRLKVIRALADWV
ncbi:hypothetical protein [Rhizobium paknamense]|uniref:Uncharacterized protein n=1 Tax=Rhizobium paknamense TaxID=1206817 RepID=A0ABU0IB09_9HYPH|nr:hypothetical protein [Rhizobium paknamense]MDQ0455415.1 hypothetical protein [Rhizobium paknamense]